MSARFAYRLTFYAVIIVLSFLGEILREKQAHDAYVHNHELYLQ